MDSTKKIAEELAAARRDGRKLQGYPGERPVDLRAAYEIQDRLIAELGWPVAGWKIGGTSPAAQQMLGVSEPLCGPIFERAILSSPAEIKISDEDLGIIEAEIGLRMGSDILPRDKTYARAEIIPAVATVHPAIEVADTRIGSRVPDGAEWIIADGGLNHAFIHGEGRPLQSAGDLAEQRVIVSSGGSPTTTGAGANAMGNPIDALHWLVNHLSMRGIPLRKGDFISTGLICDAVFPQAGDLVFAEFDGLGTARLRVTAPQGNKTT